MSSWQEEFLADCRECLRGSEPCHGGRDCDLTALNQNFLPFSPDCADCFQYLKDLEASPPTSNSNLADCPQCLAQLDMSQCTEACFAPREGSDDCDICLKQFKSSSVHASPQLREEAEAPAIWPLLSITPTPLLYQNALNGPHLDHSLHSWNSDALQFESPLTSSCHSPVLDTIKAHIPCQWSNCTCAFETQQGLTAHVLEMHLCKSTTLHDLVPWVDPKSHRNHQATDLTQLHHHHSQSSASSISFLEEGSTPSSRSSSVLPTERHVCKWKDCVGREFGSASELMKHIDSEHVPKGINSYLCNWEGCKRADSKKPFVQRQKLLRHLQVHAGDRPFECGICHRCFPDQWALNQHANVHTGTKNHPCPHPGCNRSFSLPSALTVHLRTHTKEKPFKCPHESCTLSFTDSSNLRKHVLTHTKEKRFVCDFGECGKRFARSDQLARHKKVHIKAQGECS